MKKIIISILLVAILIFGGVAMAHGKNDYGATAPRQTVFALQDMAELAARLGSIDTFDRSGDVVWMDDFENGITKWETYGDGTGTALASDTTYARNGGKSAKCTTGSDGALRAGIRTLKPRPVDSGAGFEISFTLQDNFQYFEFYFILTSGSTRLIPALRVDVANNKIMYRNSAGVYISLLDAVALVKNPLCFNTCKLVVDISTNMYVKALINQYSFDLSALSIQSNVSAIQSYFDIRAFFIGDSGQNRVAYLDDFILTQNEP